MTPNDNISDDLLEMRRIAQRAQLRRPTRPQRMARAKELAKEVEEAQAKLKEVGRKYKLVSTVRSRSENVDWTKNEQRAERLREIIATSQLTKKEIATYLGMSRENLYYYLTGRSPVNSQIEGHIEQAVRDLLEERRIRANKAFAVAAMKRD